MKPAPFDYYAPEVLGDALAIRAELGSAAVPLAGGQTLVARLSRRDTTPRAVIDLNPIASLTHYQLVGQRMRLGAMVRQAAVLNNGPALESWGGLRDAIACMGFAATRARGTIGGALVAALASGQATLTAHLFDAELELSSVRGTRTIGCGEFFEGVETVNLMVDELLSAIELRATVGTCSAYCECRSRTGGPVLAAAGLALTAHTRDVAGPARLYVAGVVELPRRMPRTEEALRQASFPLDVEQVMNSVTVDLAEMNRRMSRVRVGQVRAVVRRAWLKATERTHGSHCVIAEPTNHNGTSKETL
jgi:aerobic carbon-monoxide dehydrogenase medium subunit